MALGGALGSVLRYLVSVALPGGGGWPWGTLAVNVVGAFLLGWLLEALAMRGRESERLRRARLFAGTGVLGGFTTYSTLALETYERVAFSAWAPGLAYVLVTLVLGTLAALLGVAAGRRT